MIFYLFFIIIITVLGMKNDDEDDNEIFFTIPFFENNQNFNVDNPHPLSMIHNTQYAHSTVLILCTSICYAD